MNRSISNALKIALLPLLLYSSMDGIQNKTPAENYDLHKDDKTEADRIATLSAHARLNKTEQPDYDSWVRKLGNPVGPSLSTLLAVDAQMYKENKKKKARKIESEKALKFAAANPQSQKYLGFDKFHALPLVLQQKIMEEYYDTPSPGYILRHKREIAPLLYHHYHLKPEGEASEFNAHTLLNHIDTVIITIKKEINKIIVKLPERYDSQTVKKLAPHIWARHSTYPSKNKDDWHRKKLVDIWDMNISVNHSNNDDLFASDAKKREVSVGNMYIVGYSDRTYDILLNANQLKQLANTYSLDQLSFFVSLAHIEIPKGSNPASIQLTSTQCALFKSLDYEMQGRLKKLYPWVDFYRPNDCTYSFCDRIEDLPHRVLAKGAFDTKTSYYNTLMWWKTLNLSTKEKCACAAIAFELVILAIHVAAYPKGP